MSQYVLDVSAMELGYTRIPELTNRGGAYARVFIVVEEASSPTGKALELRNSTSTTHRYMTWDTPGSVQDMQVFMLIRPISAPNTGGMGLYLRASTAGDSGYFGHTRNSDGQYGLSFANSTTTTSSINFGSDPVITSGTVLAVRFEINGTTLRERHWHPANVANPLADEPGTWSWTGTRTDVAGPGYVAFGGRDMADGQRLLFASMTDSPGTEDAPGPIQTDTTAPVVTVDEIHGTGQFASIYDSAGYDAMYNTLTVSGTATDGLGSGVASVEVRVNGGAWQAADGKLSWSKVLNVADLPSGEFAIEARATDADANVTTSFGTRTVWYSPSGLWSATSAGSHATPVGLDGY